MPKFERVKDHVFQQNEDVYVIDDNGFDIYNAKIVDINDGEYKVHYPDYPDDDTYFSESDISGENGRFLVMTAINTKEFNRQEKIRMKKERELDGDYEEDEPERKRKKTKKTKQKKTKEPKPKKEKTPKAPRPKKTKPLRKVSQHQHNPSSVGYFVKQGLNKGITSVEDFREWLDREDDPNNFKQTHYEEIVQKFEMILSRKSSGQVMEYNDDDYDEEEEDGFEFEEEEEINEDHSPESLLLITPPEDIPSAQYLRLPTYIGYESNQTSQQKMSLLFKDGNPNFFIYRVGDTDYLIVNGMKFEINKKQIDSDCNTDILYDRKRARPGNGEFVSRYHYEGAAHLEHISSLSITPEQKAVISSQGKSKVNKTKAIPFFTSALNDVSEKETKRNKKSTKKTPELTEEFINDDESDYDADYSDSD